MHSQTFQVKIISGGCSTPPHRLPNSSDAKFSTSDQHSVAQKLHPFPQHNPLFVKKTGGICGVYKGLQEPPLQLTHLQLEACNLLPNAIQQPSQTRSGAVGKETETPFRITSATGVITQQPKHTLSATHKKHSNRSSKSTGKGRKQASCDPSSANNASYGAPLQVALQVAWPWPPPPLPLVLSSPISSDGILHGNDEGLLAALLPSAGVSISDGPVDVQAVAPARTLPIRSITELLTRSMKVR